MPFPIETPALAALSPELHRIVTDHVAAALGHDAPFLLHMIGVPGVGKTSLITPLQDVLADYAPVLVGFDQIMGQIPAYQSMAVTAPVEAFSAYELPARAAGYRLLAELLAKRASIIFDNGGAAASHRALLHYAQNLGYQIIMVHVVAENETALHRLALRQATEGRYTPPEYITGRAAAIESLLADYHGLADHYHTVVNPDRPEAQRQAFLALEAAKIAASFTESAQGLRASA